jgi:heat shock transcription factor 2
LPPSLLSSRSEDGETFIVKQPDTFSSEIIPQFFKHSKFTSFVRQLNFYGFRKIKYSDSIKIDEKLEKQTKDYWRFRHECFRQGREDLLVGIKRSNSTQTNEKKPAAAVTTGGTLHVPAQTSDSKKEVTELKQELDTLKEKMAKMTDNIDSLTNLVQKVKLVDDVPAGSKRKKIEEPEAVSDDDNMSIEADAIISLPADDTSNAISSISFTPSNIFPSPLEPATRQNSESSKLSDTAFVDELFNALDDGNDMDFLPDCVISEAEPERVMSLSSNCEMTVTPTQTPVKQENEDVSSQNPNAPEPELMKNLSNALSVLPKDMQELLVNRLIATITSSGTLKAHIDSITESNAGKTTKSESKSSKQVVHQPPALENLPEIALPLAAATLTALMTHLSATMKNKPCVASEQSLPVIPIHA